MTGKSKHIALLCQPHPGNFSPVACLFDDATKETGEPATVLLCSGKGEGRMEWRWRGWGRQGDGGHCVERSIYVSVNSDVFGKSDSSKITAMGHVLGEGGVLIGLEM